MASVVHTASTSTATYTFNVGAAGLTGASGSSVTVSSGQYFPINGNGNITLSGASNITGAGLYVSSDAEIEGTLKVGGKDIAKSLEAIEKRLAILQPNPKKLEKFEALRKAYEHYKLLEALCYSDEDK